MNSVHEQCLISDLETVLSQKLVKCTVCTHSLASTPRRAQWSCRSAARAPLRAVPCAYAPLVVRLCPLRLRLARLCPVRPRPARPCASRRAPRASLAQRPRAPAPSLMLKWAVAHFKFCIFFFFLFFRFSLTLDHFVQISSKPPVLTLTLIFNLKNFI